MAAQSDVEREVELILSGALPDIDLRQVTCVGHGDNAMLRVVVDHPEGVDHETCVAVTRALDTAGMRDRFGIEVSSPGPEPPLRTVEHYAAAIGSRVAISVAADDTSGGKSVSGVINEVSDEGITIMTSDGEREIPLAHIRRGRIVERSEG